MHPEKPPLTPEGVKQIMTSESQGAVHPVMAIIQQHRSRIDLLNAGYAGMTDSREKHEFTSSHYGFLAESFVEAGPFALEASDLVAIWSQAVKLFDLYQRYQLARMISLAYAVQGLENPGWRKFPRHYIEHSGRNNQSYFPDEVLNDIEGLEQILENLDTIQNPLDEVRLVNSQFSQIHDVREEELLTRELVENFNGGLYSVNIRILNAKEAVEAVSKQEPQ